MFTLPGPALAIAIIVYGFAASALPVWLLLAPRDYLSAFIKVGVVLALAGGILLVRPTIHMPPLTRFIDGTGPVFAGTIFPFCFITIACGAVSGFHALVASGTTPKLLMREGHTRLVGYGSMLMESFVGIMAMVAACALTPGVYFAIMFEALFILTVLDAGTRVGRFMVQELLGHVWAPMGRTGWYPSILSTSALIVGAWGYFLYQGVLDPLGGINSLWPLFGIANQLLAAVALVVATTILIKMGRTRWLWITLVPTAWLIAVTMTASWQKIYHSDPRLGFLAQARTLSEQIAAGAIPAAKVAATERLIFNARLDAGVTAVFAGLILVLIAEALFEWYRILSGRRAAVLKESPYVGTRWAEVS